MKNKANNQKDNSKNKIKTNIIENEKELANEKEYLIGIEHKNPKDINQNNKNMEKPPNVGQTPEENNDENAKEEEKKKMIEIKPRETYLKDKIGKMQFNNNVLSGINKGIGQQLSSVKKDIISTKVVLSKDAPKDLEKYINKSFEASSNKNKDEIFNLKNKYKSIKELKKDKDILSRKLIQIVENENLLENKNDAEHVVEQNVKEKIKKEMLIKKNKIIRKLENVNEKIKNILIDVEDSGSKKQDKIKNFMDNFERDKEIIEIRAKKYLMETKERNKRIANDLNQLAEKRKKEIEDLDKKEKEKQEKMATKLKRQAKQIENKRSKEVGEKSLLYKPYMNEKIEGTANNYLFMQKYKNFIKNEQNLIDKENMSRKIKMKQITTEELEEFNNKMDKIREEKQLIQDKKTEKLYEDWNKRKNTIPSYVSPFSEKAYEKITNPAEKEKEDKKIKEELIKKKLDWSKQIGVPKINKDLEQKRLESISNLDPKRFLIEKETLQHTKRKGRVILKKPDPQKPSKFSWKLKILNNSENELSIERTLVRKPKQYKNTISVDRSSTKLPNIKKDYLQEIIKEKENQENIKKVNSSKILTNEQNYVKSSEKKWKKIITKDGNGSLVDNINNAKNKINLLELKAMQTEQLMKVREPMSNDVELNKKVSNLLIDSIEGKLSLLNQMK
jgi:hypothetical protein